MSDERELKLQLLKMAEGDTEEAAQMFAFVTGADRPTPDQDFEAGFWCGLQDSPMCPGSESGQRGHKQGQLARKYRSELDRMQAQELDRARAALHPPVDRGGGGETETPSVLSEFMKRPGAVAVERGEMIEINKEPCHWLYASGHIQTATNPTIIWRNTEYPGPIIAYAPVIPPDTTTQNPSLEAFLAREGAVKWEGQDVYTPTPDTEEVAHHVELLFRNGDVETGLARSFNWAWSATEHFADILAYRPISPEPESDQVLDAEPAPVLRSDVPPDATTYEAPSGATFAQVGGETRLVVSDEAEVQAVAETPAAEAYGAAHEVANHEARMFAHGLVSDGQRHQEPSIIEKLFGSKSKVEA
jgi:hypothetical protein